MLNDLPIIEISMPQILTHPFKRNSSHAFNLSNLETSRTRQFNPAQGFEKSPCPKSLLNETHALPIATLDRHQLQLTLTTADCPPRY
jgi:hypothetical protein